MKAVQIISQLIILAVLLFLVFFFQELTTSNYIQQILPSWPFVLVIYLSLSSRFYFGIVSAFLVGLLQDLFLAYPLFGLHACLYALTAFIMISIRSNFRYSSIFMQSLVIGLLTFFKVLISLIFLLIFYAPTVNYVIFLSVFLTAFMWPWIYIILEKIMSIIYHE